MLNDAALLRRFAAALAVATVLMTHPVLASEGPKPNIVFIVADDLGWGHVGWQNPKVATPNLDRLAARGVILVQHYVAPVCSPTRVSLMTGRYWSRFGVNDPLPSEPTSKARAMLPGTETIATVLKAAGYRTAHIGKWHLGAQPEDGPERFGFDFFYGIRVGGCTPLTHKWLGIGPSVLWRNDSVVEEEGHITELFGREARRWIIQDGDAPFFLYLSFTSPHVPLLESERWMGKHEDTAPDLSHQLYWAAIAHLDETVGWVVAAIEQMDPRENTLVVFFGDNGAPGQPNLMQVRADHEQYLDVGLPGNNLPLRGKKGDLYEGGIRVPAFACWPAVLPPGTCEVPLHVADWLPTVAALVGRRTKNESQADGRNILPVLMGTQVREDPRTVYFKRGQGNAALREGDWKLILHAGREPELYHLGEDIGESNNRASEQPQLVRRLTALLQKAAARDNDAVAEPR